MMLNQAHITQTASPALSLVPVVRSASDTRAFVILQLVLIKGTNEQYVSHPEFHHGFENGYECESEFQEFEETEVTFEYVLETLESCLSHLQHEHDNKMYEFAACEPIPYAYHVGFVLGFLRWMFDAGRTPVVPLSLLQKWYSIEYLTRSLTARFVVQEQSQQPYVQTIALGIYWE